MLNTELQEYYRVRNHLYNTIAVLEAVIAEGLSDEDTYSMIFGERSNRFCAAYTAHTGQRFDWFDPDTTYAEDVQYFMDAVRDVKSRFFGENQDDNC